MRTHTRPDREAVAPSEPASRVPECAVSSTYSRIEVHVVFSVKDRQPLIADEWRLEFHKYIGGTIKGLGAQPLGVGGTADHVHMLAGLRPADRPSDLVREIKKASSLWAAARQPAFSWQRGYGIFGIGPGPLRTLQEYVTKQVEHHRKVSAKDELLEILRLHGIEPLEWFE